MTSTRTDTYALAHLAGGPPRVADTAVVALLGRGLLRAEGGSLLATAGTRTGHPVEDAVLALTGDSPRRSALTVRVRLTEDPRVAALTERLVADGLLRRDPWAWLGGSRPAHVPTAAGRRALAEARRQPVLADDVRVALDGVAAMADQGLRLLVFGTGPQRPRPAARRPRWGEPYDGRWSSGSVFAWGGGDGGGGGGGGWGGDGGGCGGGDGGGGGGGGC